MRAFLLETPPHDVVDHMSLDEAVLDHAVRACGSGPVCYLRVYEWADRTPRGVTFGYSQAYSDVESAVRGRYGGVTVPLVRRSTGGGIVYHDEELTFSFVFPWERTMDPVLVYKKIHSGIHSGLKAQGISSRLWTARSTAPGAARRGIRPECFTAPEAEDLVHEDGEKFVGGALRRRQGCGLYQGSMRTERFPVRERLLRAIGEGFSLRWRALFEPVGPEVCVAAAAKRLRLDKYSKDSWNKKR